MKGLWRRASICGVVAGLFVPAFYRACGLVHGSLWDCGAAMAPAFFLGLPTSALMLPLLDWIEAAWLYWAMFGIVTFAWVAILSYAVLRGFNWIFRRTE